MPLIHRLSSSTVKLISSSQTITSVSSVVKELLENSIDAGAANIEIKLDNNGLDGIEVRDNGFGVSKGDITNMCQPNCTSKIQQFDDLEQLQSYGFRGEALNAICRVAEVSITTRTKDDNLAMVYTMDHNGTIAFSKPSALSTGTTVTVTRLFNNLPVRKQYLNSGKRAKEELKKTENVIKSLAVIKPSLRVTFCHNKCLIWQKQTVTKLRDSLMQVVGHVTVNKLEELSHSENELNVTLLIPKKSCEIVDTLWQSNIECMMVYINKRPVRYKKIEKVVLRCISERFDNQLMARKYPTCLVSVVTSPSDLDVNLEPNKTKVMLKDEEQVLQLIENMLVTYYGIKLSTPEVIRATENDLNSTDMEINENSINLKESRKQCETLKIKAKQTVAVMNNNNNFNKTEAKEVGNTHKRLRLDVTEEENSEKVIKNDVVNFCNEIDSKNDGKADFELLTSYATADNSFPVIESSPFEVTNTNSCSSLTDLNSTFGEMQSLNRSADNAKSLAITSISALESLSSGRLPISDSVVENVVNRATNFQDMPLGRHSQNMLDTKMLAGTIGQNEANELFVLDETDIFKELGTELNTDKNANDKTVLSNIRELEHEIVSAQEIEATLLNESELQSNTFAPQNGYGQQIAPENEEICKAVKPGENANSAPKAQEICLPVVGSLSNRLDTIPESWSRGQIKAPNGNILQGAAVLLSKSRGEVQPKTIDMSLQRVSGQMEKKEHKAFVKFSKEERANILRENPGITFTKIPGILLERWQALSSEEQTRYQEIEKPKSNTVRSTDEQDLRKLLNRTGQNETIKTKERWKIGNRRQQEMTVSMEKLQQPSEIIATQTEPPEVLLIGYIHPDGPWIYKKNKELGIVRHWALKETVVYHRMMAEHTVPLQKLDIPVLVNERAVGPDNMQLLLSLKRNYDVETHAVIVTSEVIQKNGFRVEVKEGLEQTHCLLTDVACTINFYGLNDLRDTLDILHKRGIGPLEKCRNLRVAGYIRGEAVRIVHQSPIMLDKEAVQELVNYWSTNVTLLGYECLHRKPFFEKLHDLSA